MVTRYALAPMDRLLRALTWFCLAAPVILGFAASQAPAPFRTILFGTVGLMFTMYVVIWLVMRPTAFVVAPDGLVIEWPVRRRLIEAAAITGARVIDANERRRELGRVVRVGAGGLGGGFGLARTSRGMLELWVSRTDWMVLVECRGRRSLLLTPEDPEQFVRALLRRAA